jgi:hypothetical protein
MWPCETPGTNRSSFGECDSLAPGQGSADGAMSSTVTLNVKESANA